MKLGVFGGTFDPPHHGHLIVSEYVRYRLGLDRILFVPSWISPHKQERQAADGSCRLDMLRLAVSGFPEFEVSDIEVQRGGVSYTVDTLRSLASTTRAELSLLIGADNFVDFRTWHEPEQILSLARLVVMSRPGSPFPPDRSLPSGILPIEVPDIMITATEIRTRVGEKRSIRYFVPPPVERYILQNHLYEG